MKKFVIALCAALFLPGIAMAATACSAGSGTLVTGDTANFVQVSFTPKCSANTIVDYNQNATAFWMGAASVKGKTSFGGSSSGGAVAKMTDCTLVAGCAAGDLASALASALAACGSSCTGD